MRRSVPGVPRVRLGATTRRIGIAACSKPGYGRSFGRAAPRNTQTAHARETIGTTTSLPTRTRLDPAVASEIVRRIVDAVAPERIILFGSAARDRMGPHSDVDLLIVKDAESKRDVTIAVRRALRGVPEAFDIVVATPDELERYRDSFALVYRTALEEGKLLYAA